MRDVASTDDGGGRPEGRPDLALSVRHHLPLIAAAVILALGLAGFYVASTPPSYTSSGVILLNPAPGNPLTAESASSSGTQLTVAMGTEEQMVFTAAVRSGVSEELGREAPDDAERLEVAVRPNTQMLEVSFTSSSPEQAQAGAEAFTEGYLDYRGLQAESTQNRRVEQFQGQVDETDANLQRAIQGAVESGGSSYASQEVQLYASRLAQLRDQLSGAEVVSTNPGSVIDPTELPEDSDNLPSWLILAAAGVMGLFLGVILAALLEWRRGRVRGTGSSGLDLPVFATIPSTSEGGSDGSVEEAFRRLRGAVIANAPRPHVLAVTSVDSQPTAMVGADLALTLAEARFSVLLVETSPTESSRVMGLHSRPGVAEVIADGADPAALLVGQRGFSVLGAGQGTERLKDLTAASSFRAMIDDLRGQFDYVVLDAVGESSVNGDEALLAADSALLILTVDRTTRAQLGVALERLRQLGVVTLGMVHTQRIRRGGVPGTILGGRDTVEKSVSATEVEPRVRT